MFPHPTSRKIARLQAFSRKLLLMRLTPAWELRPFPGDLRLTLPLRALSFQDASGARPGSAKCSLEAEKSFLFLPFLTVNRDSSKSCTRNSAKNLFASL